MSLLTEATTVNLDLQNAKKVVYSKTKVYGSWVSTPVVFGTPPVVYSSVWEHARYATGSFRYVGMTLDAANAAAATLRKAYTRSFKISTWDGSANSGAGGFDDEDGGTILMADIEVVSAGGDAYDVVVNVREEDHQTRTTSAVPSWTAENARSYPGLE